MACFNHFFVFFIKYTPPPTVADEPINPAHSIGVITSSTGISIMLGIIELARLAAEPTATFPV